MRSSCSSSNLWKCRRKQREQWWLMPRMLAVFRVINLKRQKVDYRGRLKWRIRRMSNQSRQIKHHNKYQTFRRKNSQSQPRSLSCQLEIPLTRNKMKLSKINLAIPMTLSNNSSKKSWGSGRNKIKKIEKMRSKKAHKRSDILMLMMIFFFRKQNK